MLLFGESHERDSSQEASSQVEGLPRLFERKSLNLILTFWRGQLCQIQDGKIKSGRRRDGLDEVAAGGVERCAERFVAANNFGDAALEAD